MYIARIEPIQKSKVKVCFDDGTDFVLYRKEANRFDLQAETELTPEVYDRILTEVFYPRAKRRAMHLLEKMDRSENNLRRKLSESGYPPEAIDVAIAYVESYHYIDDDRMAHSYVRMYQETRSRQRIRQDLMGKGISRDSIERALEEEYLTDETDLIRQLLLKKHYDPEEADPKTRQKMYAFLAGRGFSSSDISRVLREEF